MVVFAVSLIGLGSCGGQKGTGEPCSGPGDCTSGHCIVNTDHPYEFCTDVCTTVADCPDIAGHTKSCEPFAFSWAGGHDWCSY
jgi:hypothetical protein